MTDTRCVNPVYAIEVDEMILEYLLYTTIKAHVKEAKTNGIRPSFRSETPQHLLRMFDSFISLFKVNHKGHEFSAETDFNIRLLQLLLLFVYQRDPAYITGESPKAIELLRQRSHTARKVWLAVHRNLISESEQTLYSSWDDYSYSRALEKRPGTISRHVTDAGIWLKDLLPLFMSLSATMARKLGQTINEQWMKLAAEFMLQSVLEQYCNKDPDLDCLRIAFSWGWQPQELREDILSYEDKRNELCLDEVEPEVLVEEKRISDLFAGKIAEEESTEDEGSPNDELLRWNAIRREYLDCFGKYPDSKSDISVDSVVDLMDESHNQLARREWLSGRIIDLLELFDMDKFEQMIIAYLEGLCALCQKPLLVQVEEGEIDGLTKEQFGEFRKNCFLDACVSFGGEDGAR